MKPSDPSEHSEGQPEGPQAPGGSNDYGRYATLGLQFALTIVALCGLGWWLDTRWGSTPWCLVAGAILGFVAGFANLVRAVPTPPDPKRRPPGAPKPPSA